MKYILSLLVLIVLFSCSSKKTDKELFDEAKKNLTENKIPEAVTGFDQLVSDYPDSKLAPEALSQLASVYQNKMVKNLSEQENLEKAVSLFKEVHDKYPDSEYAPSGLFMAAFISANDLKKYEEATSLYKQFLKEYPNNDLAASAQAELDNMGKSPEEILRNNVANEK
jgi:TolA-binding protein